MSVRLIPLEVLTFPPDEFKQRVSDYVAEYNDWAAHMRRVKADAAANVPMDVRHQPYPGPVPVNAQVGSCVKTDEDGNAYEDYVIHYPEGPSPEQIFADKQQKLFQELASAEQAARAAVLHPRKSRLLSLQVGAAMQVAESDRTPDQAAILESFRLTNEKLNAIELQGATMENEIADLRPDNIDLWQLRPFA